MANCYNERDLDIIPDLTFTFVENYVKSCKSSSGQKSVNKDLSSSVRDISMT